MSAVPRPTGLRRLFEPPRIGELSPGGKVVVYAVLAFWTAFGVASGCWLVALLGFARRFLRATPRLLAHAARAVFPIYLLHQTVIVLVAYHVVRWPMGVSAKFGVLLMLSFALTVALAELAAAIAPIRRALGVKDVPDVRLQRRMP